MSNKPVATSPKLALNQYLNDMLMTATEQPEDNPEVEVQTKVEVQVELKSQPEFEPKTVVVEEPAKREADPAISMMPEVKEVEARTVQRESLVATSIALPQQEKKKNAETQSIKEAQVAADNSKEADREIKVQVKPKIGEWAQNGKPQWAQERFDCLLFEVSGLKLAVPMVLLGTIFPLEKDITPLFGQPEWFLGMMKAHSGQSIRIVDTAQLVMPERYDKASKQTVKFAIGIHGCDWAMSANKVLGSISLLPEGVRWRSARTSRPWLAGTVIEHMCALMDVDAFGESFLS